MKVVHIMTSQRGGAARAALRLHHGLRSQAVDSMFYAKNVKNDEVAGLYGFSAQRDFLSRVKVRIRKDRMRYAYRVYSDSRPGGLEMYSDDRSEFGAQVVNQLPECDIINLHWIAQFVDYRSFFSSVRQPIVWTLHDMNPFTGGCHYAADCDRFLNMCGACPQLGSTNERDLSRAILRRKAKVFSSLGEGRLHIVTPSKWLQKEAQASALFQQVPVSVIANGLDTNDFSPRDSGGLKSALGIPEDAKVVLFAADSVDNQRKGFSLLLDALRDIDSLDKLFFLSIGGGQARCPVDHYIHLGNIENDLLMSIIYSLADVFVIPSLQDNLPNTVIESMACGTPVIGFDLGGIPDMVRHGQTGLLVEALNVAGLRQAIEMLLKDETKREQMSHQCRRVVEVEYDVRIQAHRYTELYQSILESSAQRASR